MKRLLPLFALLAPLLCAGQENDTCRWTYRGTYLGLPHPLDYVVVENLSRGGYAVLDSTDDWTLNVACMDVVGLDEHAPGSGYGVFPLGLNPYDEQTTFGVSMPVGGDVAVVVYDAMGRRVAAWGTPRLAPGVHAFRFQAERAGIYFVHATVDHEQGNVLRLLQTGTAAGPLLLHTGTMDGHALKSGERDLSFLWRGGDRIRHTAYASLACDEHDAVCSRTDTLTQHMNGEYEMPLQQVPDAVPCIVLNQDTIEFPPLCVGATSDAVPFRVAGEYLSCNSITIAMDGFLFGLTLEGLTLAPLTVPISGTAPTTVWVQANPQQAWTEPATLVLSCDDAQVELVLESPADAPPHPGGAIPRIWCGSAGMFDLFSLLDGTQTAGGEWTTNVSGVEITNEHYWDATGAPQNYYPFTYTVGAQDCSASITVGVQIHPSIDAGRDSSITVCSNTLPLRLWDYLGGTPQDGGRWIDPSGSPFGEDNFGLFDPESDTPGLYTYTRHQLSPAPCDADTATVTVVVDPAPNAGVGGAITVCGSAPVNLFHHLGGSPHTFGTWSGPGVTSTGIIIPSNLQVGGHTYNYTVGNSCGTVSSTLHVTVQEAPCSYIRIDPPLLNPPHAWPILGDRCLGSSVSIPLNLSWVGLEPGDVISVSGRWEGVIQLNQDGVRQRSLDIPVPQTNGTVQPPISMEIEFTSEGDFEDMLYISAPNVSGLAYPIFATVYDNTPYIPLVTQDDVPDTHPDFNIMRLSSSVHGSCTPEAFGFQVVLAGTTDTVYHAGTGAMGGDGLFTFRADALCSELPYIETYSIRALATYGGVAVYGGSTTYITRPWSIPHYPPHMHSPPGDNSITFRGEGRISWLLDDEGNLIVNTDGDGNIIGPYYTYDIATDPLFSPESIIMEDIRVVCCFLDASYTFVGLEPITTYYVRARAVNANGLVGPYHPDMPYAYTTRLCPYTVTDWDDNTYPVQQIGNQCWMAQNLRTSLYRDGSPIPHAPTTSEWMQADTNWGAWCYYNNNENNSLYGKLYNWYAVTRDSIGLCPAGWHVPNDAEWKEMELTVDVPEGQVHEWAANRGAIQNAGGKLKSKGVLVPAEGDIYGLWQNPNLGANAGPDPVGFMGHPGGRRHGGPSGQFGQEGQFLHQDSIGYWWTSSGYDGVQGPEANALKGWGRWLTWNQGGIDRRDVHKKTGLSVRCIKD